MSESMYVADLFLPAKFAVLVISELSAFIIVKVSHPKPVPPGVWASGSAL